MTDGNLNTLDVEQVENPEVAVEDSGKIEVDKIEVEPKKEEPPKEDSLFSKRFAALSKREKAIRQRETELNNRVAQLEERLKSLDAPKAEPVKEPLEYRLKRDPLKALEEAGLPFEKLTQLVLNDGKLPAESQMQLIKEELDNKYKAEIENLRKEMADKEAKRQEEESKKQSEHEKQVIENFKTELGEFINSNADYELIQANNAVGAVFDVIELHYNKTGKVLSNKEAADAVESHLLQEALKLTKLKKLAQQKEAVSEKKQEIKVNEPSLSNSHAASLSKGTGKKLVSDDESKLAAAAMIRWDD